MKKLIILISILGMASLANAALELSFNGVTDGPGNTTLYEVYCGQEVIIDVYGPAEYNYLGYIIIEGRIPSWGGEWGDDLGPPYEPKGSGYYYEKPGYPIVHPGAGDLAYAARYEEEGWGFGYEILAESLTGGVTGGLQFEFRYRHPGSCAEYVTVTLWDNAEGYDIPQDTIIIVDVPEPATIALLGLGVLGILGRKHVA